MLTYLLLAWSDSSTLTEHAVHISPGASPETVNPLVRHVLEYVHPSVAYHNVRRRRYESLINNIHLAKRQQS